MMKRAREKRYRNLHLFGDIGADSLAEIREDHFKTGLAAKFPRTRAIRAIIAMAGRSLCKSQGHKGQMS